MQRKLRLVAASGLMLLCLAASASGAQARRTHGAGAARLAFARHAGSVKRGHTVVITLNRTTRSACDLTISAPGARARTFGYSEGSGAIQFAIRPSRLTRLGLWTLKAACVPFGRVAAHHAATRLTVTGNGRGSAFLVGKGGPAYEVPVRFGAVDKIAPLPSGGRGGDPGNDYPWAHVRQDSGADPWGEDYRECTSFVAWALHSRNDYNMRFHDDAYNWGIDAGRLGIPVDNTPAVGAVAWEPRLPGHYWGHVMWVSAVSGPMVTVEEYNEHGNGTYDKRTFNVRSEPYKYIHFKDLSYTPPSVPTVPPPPPATTQVSATHSETSGSVANTWTDYSDAGGTEGPSIAAGQTVQIACKLLGFTVSDGNTWWYQIASSPWNDGYYVTADAFYNNGATSGTLVGTPFVDNSVPDCAGGSKGPTPAPPPTTPTTPTPPAPTPTTPTTPTPTPTTPTTPTPAQPTYVEHAGPGGATTFQSYAHESGVGPRVGDYQTIQVSCRVQGLAVSDGNPWYYRIASSPWNNTYYASADPFYNEPGVSSGSLHGTPFVDASVPTC